MIEDFFVDDISVVQVKKDAYGDLVFDNNLDTYKGRFLDHAGIVLDSEMEEARSDAIVHLPKDAVVDKGSILKYGNGFYRVIKKINAKRGKTTEIMFIKVYLEEHKSLEGIS